MQYEPMVGLRYDRIWYVSYEFTFDGIGSGAALRDEANAVAYTKHMGINSHCSFFEDNSLNHIRSLPSYAW